MGRQRHDRWRRDLARHSDRRGDRLRWNGNRARHVRAWYRRRHGWSVCAALRYRRRHGSMRLGNRGGPLHCGHPKCRRRWRHSLSRHGCCLGGLRRAGLASNRLSLRRGGVGGRLNLRTGSLRPWRSATAPRGSSLRRRCGIATAGLNRRWRCITRRRSGRRRRGSPGQRLTTHRTFVVALLEHPTAIWARLH